MTLSILAQHQKNMGIIYRRYLENLKIITSSFIQASVDFFTSGIPRSHDLFRRIEGT
jgi:hypothetical protein